MTFSIEVTISCDGYLEVEAANEAEARKKVAKLEPEIHFPSFTLENTDIDVSNFDGIGAEISTGCVCPVEDE